MQSLGQSQSPSASQRFLPLLTLLFIGSGCSALIYEVVWLQSLQLVIGSSAVSLGVLLGTFMGGMCLGSLVLPRVVSVRRHPLRVYALIEMGIGIAGIALLFGMPYVDQIYAAHVRPGLASILMRGAVCAICLLPPTVLMGATLPAMAPLGRGHTPGRLLAGVLLRQQYRRGGLRVPPGRLLPAESPRWRDRHLCRGGPQFHRGRDRPASGRPGGLPAVQTAGSAVPTNLGGNWKSNGGHAHPTGFSNAGDLDHLHSHRPVRPDCTGRGSRVDAESVAAARRDRLHVLHHSRGLSPGAGHRQQHRVGDLPP